MIPPPGWFFEASAGIDQINVMLSSMTVWIPVGLLSGVLTVWLATLLAGWGLKLGRIVLSLFTAGGGSAA